MDAYVDALAALHGVDAGRLALPGFARPEPGDPARAELALWRGVLEARVTRPAPLARFAFAWLERNAPRHADRISLCHGDVGPGNFLRVEGASPPCSTGSSRISATRSTTSAGSASAATTSRTASATSTRSSRAGRSAPGLPAERRRIAWYRALVMLRMLVSCQAALDSGAASLDRTVYFSLAALLGAAAAARARGARRRRAGAAAGAARARARARRRRCWPRSRPISRASCCRRCRPRVQAARARQSAAAAPPAGGRPSRSGGARRRARARSPKRSAGTRPIRAARRRALAERVPPRPPPRTSAGSACFAELGARRIALWPYLAGARREAAREAALMAGPEDDRFHAPVSRDPWWTETCWFSFGDPRLDLSGTFYPLFRRNLGVAALGVAIWDASAHEPWRVPTTARTGTCPGRAGTSTISRSPGCATRRSSRGRRYRVRYRDGELVDVDLDYRALIPVHEVGVGGGHGHLDQPCRFEGVVTLHGRRHEVVGLRHARPELAGARRRPQHARELQLRHRRRARRVPRLHVPDRRRGPRGRRLPPARRREGRPRGRRAARRAQRGRLAGARRRSKRATRSAASWWPGRDAQSPRPPGQPRPVRLDELHRLGLRRRLPRPGPGHLVARPLAADGLSGGASSGFVRRRGAAAGGSATGKCALKGRAGSAESSGHPRSDRA